MKKGKIMDLIIISTLLTSSVFAILGMAHHLSNDTKLHLEDAAMVGKHVRYTCIG